MEYCIVELADSATDPRDGSEVQRFESAYRAADALQELARRHDSGGRYWCLVDGRGQVLARSADLDDEAA